ncbi:cytochrome c oxidase accessory protein CcoG [Bacteroidetes bacterium endosymbiont of Geopemphigus sp.]|uniref:cytochrome c oxidase accessory protein CcoG n=1 Tax=Bacteroidetes bacterium endosymbiont of Geopemphigus sp. TaxID=2047937 RepID=UPI000CD1300A|nr:cytochrome c oxidase accessory protein CcoG [Bacteroidetes bacterium endosymbiont of Geopemphigus sp.]
MESDFNSPSTTQSDSFRDHINTMDWKGVRKWVYPRKPKGRYYYRRTILSWFLLLFFLSAPFINVHGDPFLKFDVLRREFFIFSFPFYPQDFSLFALVTIITLVFIIFFTVVYGRIFCGWLCPQTIFLEMLFRKIEYAIEGDKGAQQRLNRQAWDEEKIRKKFLKWSIFALLSLLMSHVLFAYFLGADVLFKSIEEGPFQNAGVFLMIFINTGVIYFVYSWFREQVCTLVCPYGRFQSVLIDKHTIVVAYDYKRGEGTTGRAKFKKGEDRQELGKGDCINCGQCVAVCPTGIDIRNGTQLECVNCTVCMDACDDIMDKIDKPRGLVRYTSEYSISTRKKSQFTSRMFAYTAVLVLLVGMLGVLLAFRTPVEVKILRVPGSEYNIQGDQILNFYEYALINKSSKTVNLHFKVLCCKGEIYFPYDQKQLRLFKGENHRGKLRVIIPRAEISQAKTSLRIGVYDQNGRLMDIYTTAFLGPFKF